MPCIWNAIQKVGGLTYGTKGRKLRESLEIVLKLFQTLKEMLLVLGILKISSVLTVLCFDLPSKDCIQTALAFLKVIS